MTIAKLAERARPRAMTINPRRSGYVTQAMVNRHGSFREALAVLNQEARHG